MACCCLPVTAVTPAQVLPAPPEVSFPLAAVSEFNSQYRCRILSATVSLDALTLTLAVRGDGSRGPLQAASDSVLTVGWAEWPPSATKPAPGCNGNEWNGTLSFSRRGWCGVSLRRSATVCFKFGDIGWPAVELFTLNEAFFRAHPGLADLVIT